MKCREDQFSYEIIRQSLDARHKDDKKFVYTVDITIAEENRILRKVHNNNIMLTNKKEYVFPPSGEKELTHAPVIVGSGPGGFFVPGILREQVTVPLFWNGDRKLQNEKKT